MNLPEFSDVNNPLVASGVEATRTLLVGIGIEATRAIVNIKINTIESAIFLLFDTWFLTADCCE